MMMNRRQVGASLVAMAASTLAAPAVFAQQKFEMKLAYFVGDQHAMSQWLVRWSAGLEKDSGGRIAVKRFPGSQMGPVQQHYDFARTGQADVAWFLHGATPGRFPLTELVQLPYMAGSAEIGTKVLNDAELRSNYLDGEAQGREGAAAVHAPAWQRPHHKEAHPHHRRHEGTASAVCLSDHPRFRGGARRDAGGVLPTEQVEQLQKGTIDGVFIDYGGAGIAFKMGGILKYSTEMYSYVSSFGLAMNEEFWGKLPSDLQALVEIRAGHRVRDRAGLGRAGRARQEGAARGRR